MKLLLATTTQAELEGLQNLLHDDGITTELRRTGVSDEPGEEPFRAELWVMHDRDFARARAQHKDWFQVLPA